jgi:hypothetical protein
MDRRLSRQTFKTGGFVLFVAVVEDFAYSLYLIFWRDIPQLSFWLGLDSGFFRLVLFRSGDEQLHLGIADKCCRCVYYLNNTTFEDHFIASSQTSSNPFSSFHRNYLPLPLPPLSNRLQNINQRYQNWHFNQRPNRTGQSLIAVNPVDSNHHRNRQLEIIARSGETLRTTNLVPKAEFPAHPGCEEKDGEEVDEQRSRNAEDGGYLMHDAVALGAE